MGGQPELLTIGEAARLLGVTPTTLRKWDKSGKVRAHRDPVNQYRLYSLEDITKLLQERRTLKEAASPFALASETPVLEPGAVESAPLFHHLHPISDTRALRLLVRQMSRAFRDSGGGGLLERFEEISKLLYCKLYDERWQHASGEYEMSFCRGPGEDVDHVYERVVSLYEDAMNLLPDVFAETRRGLSADKRAIVRVVEILQDVNLSDTPADVKGTVYEELIRNSFEKSENQQFFTPRPVTSFMVQFLDPQPDQRLCDPACGSGGFLIEAAGHMGRALGQRTSPAVAADRLSEHLSAHLVGLEIDRRMAWIAQMNLIMHGDGRGNIHHLPGGGSLAFSDRTGAIVPRNSLDLILTNPPFGSDFSDPKHLPKYRLGRGRTSRRRGILFIERCIGWLKPEGRMGIVIDDSVLNGASNRDVRSLILEECVVEAVISLPDVTFMPYATAKASVLFLRKRSGSPDEVQGEMFMASVEHVGRKPNGDPLFGGGRDEHGRPLLLNDLPEVVDAWRAHKIGGDKAIAHLSPRVFICPADHFLHGGRSVRDNRLDVQFHHPSRKVAEGTLARSQYPTRLLTELVIVRNVAVIPATEGPDEVWRYVGLANISPRTGEYTVTERKGSQIKSAVRLFRPGDILFSRMRPELRKSVLISKTEAEGYASSECLVLCPLETARHDSSLSDIAGDRHLPQDWQADSEYLAFLLRSDLAFGQLVYQTTGVGRPRVSKSAVLGLRIPLPPVQTQRQIVAAYRMARQQYLECRRRSELELRQGDEAIEAAYAYARGLLCPEPD